MTRLIVCACAFGGVLVAVARGDAPVAAGCALICWICYLTRPRPRRQR